ncbi:FmdE family protein [Sporosarcina sp. FSL K6-3457]|uniref:FmdE family protein n=1 Tax=Sporosarcina sp. FSL K6-3457 TaxID=2978204 RepID=UPI0030FA4901
MKEFNELLKEAAEYHGHLCAGQILGVRIGMAGLKWLQIDEPVGNKSLIIYVETDRCAADALQTVTGCKLGKRSLKHMDYGKMAATFVNIYENKAVRVVVPGHVRELAKNYSSNKENPYMEAYKVMPDEELLLFEEVIVDFKPEDLPGKPLRRITCEKCGEEVNDGREVVVDSSTICKACYSTPYYKVIH